MLGRLLEFNHALRDAGIPIAISEGIDALDSLEHLDLAKKERFRAALAATLIKDEAQRPAFNTLFDLYFGTGRGPDAHETRDLADASVTRDELLEELLQAVSDGNGQAISDIARRAVGRFGRLEGSSSREWYSNYEVLRTLDPNTLLERLQQEVDDAGLTGFEAQVVVDEFERRMRQFRAAVLADTRRRVAEYRGPDAVASYAVQPLPEDLNFLSATADMAELRKAIRPLARKLATRIAMKRRRSTRGHLDIRRTIRHSLSTGGVPFETENKHRTPHRPELFILCDVSSSVARFARFALMLTHALSAQFSRVRSFAFVDAIDEVTRFFEHEDFVAAVDRMNAEAGVVSDDGHSDYGSTFERFLDLYGKDVGPRTTLLILGDARTNYRARKAGALKALVEKAHHTFWLNPEPTHDWDTGDSAASEYAAVVDQMVEVRNLKQLEEFIERKL
jgi:uncharacterized protein with von Willebrand factor type A (vWA) domain